MSELERWHDPAFRARLADILTHVAGGPPPRPPVPPYVRRRDNLFYFQPQLMIWLRWLAGHGRRHGHEGRPRDSLGGRSSDYVRRNRKP